MRKKTNKMSLAACVAILCASLLTGCGGAGAKSVSETLETDSETMVVSSEVSDEETSVRTLPKYVFLFIGDGMSYPQIQSASYYMGAVENDGQVKSTELSFMKFPVVGSAKTYDMTSFCPDSASTATSIATGNKTYSGTINMDTTMTTKYETIAEKLKKQLDYKIGILTTVNLNHATPAAFYAHQESRESYYDIGLELIESGFDYFAGGALLKPTGEEEDQKNLYELAKESQYNVINTNEEAESLSAEKGKSIVVAQTLADSDSINYNIDAQEDEWKLADYVKKGIEVLENDKGFFMMVESGKIDWACHANDAGSSIQDVIALSNGVEEAVKFYNEHPDETLIIVTADHETGGLTIGYAGTNYDTYLTNLKNQKISYAKFDKEYVQSYKENNTDFAIVLKDIKDNFGLMTTDDTDASKNSALVLTEYELGLLKAAYERTIHVGAAEQEDMAQQEYELYGKYEPLSVTVTHILNNKSGINFASYSHTGLPVPVYAIGNSAQQFGEYYDNTEIFHSLAEIMGVK